MTDVTSKDDTAPDSEQRRIGEVVGGKYEIVRPLGVGGMGIVYEAKHTVIGRRVAVKFLRAALAKREDVLGRFKREARAAGALESEHIAATIDFGVDDGVPYIVMEFLEGEDLGERLGHSGPLSVDQAVDFVIQACRGLHAAHTNGVIHRDLKPENLFLCRKRDGREQVKIVDFGIAKLHSPTGQEATRTGTTMGTPYYMSPEQSRGAKDIDQRADVYAVGVILYEALSGVRPHPGDSYNEILYHILTQPPVPIESVRPGLPAELVAVVDRALAFDRDARYGTVASLAEALAPFASGPVAPFSIVPIPPPRNFESGPGVTPLSGPGTPAVRRVDADAPTAVEVFAPTVGMPSVGGAALTPPPAARSRAVLSIIAAAVVVAVVVAGLVLPGVLRGDPPAASASAEVAASAPAPAAASSVAVAPRAPTVSASSAAAAPAAPKQVVITLKGAPPGAQVYIGGHRRGAAGDGLELPRSGNKVELVVKASGYYPRTFDVTPDRDRKLAVRLFQRVAPAGKTGHQNKDLENPF